METLPVYKLKVQYRTCIYLNNNLNYWADQLVQFLLCLKPYCKINLGIVEQIQN